MRIDSSGQVGIGTTSITDKLTVYGGIKAIQSDSVNTSAIALDFDSDIARVRSTVNGTGTQRPLGFFIGGSENMRMRIDASGNLLVGKTSDAFEVEGSCLRSSPITNASLATFTRDSSNVAAFNRLTNDGSLLTFYKDGTAVGSIGSRASTAIYIDSHGSAGKVGLDIDSFILPRNNGALATSGVYLGTGSYRFQQLFVNESTSVSSDRRLKENIADADDAGTVIDSLQIRKFDWIENGKHQDYGVIAQEVLEVVPDAVQVPEDEDGRMGVSYETFIPMLIKEVQSLRSRVAELENV